MSAIHVLRLMYQRRTQMEINKKNKYTRSLMKASEMQNLLDAMPKKTNWGRWFFDADSLCLRWSSKNPAGFNISYIIEFERVSSNAAIADWIFQINGKNWGMNEVPDLINAFDDILKPQSNCCSGFKEKKFSGTKLAKKYKQYLES
jgi:hypothetical protein